MERLNSVRAALACALPVMLGYAVIGIPCGIMSAAAGFSPLMCFVVSCTFYSGAGQFMIAPMLLAGSSLPAIIASVVLVSSRQMLYSAAFSPYFKRVGKRKTLLFSLFVTDESFGVLMDKMSSAASWSVDQSILVNIFCMLSWSVANAVGAVVGSVVELPVGLLSFGMTSIFICLLMGQPKNTATLVCVLGAFVGVLVCKLVGLGSVAILLGAVVGVASGLAFEAVRGS